MTIRNAYLRAARLALSLIDARVKVARQVIDYSAAACSYHRCPACEREHAEAVKALDALARELEPEPKEPTLAGKLFGMDVVQVEGQHPPMLVAPCADGSMWVSSLGGEPRHIERHEVAAIYADAVRAALERAKASDTAEGRARAKGGQS